MKTFFIVTALMLSACSKPCECDSLEKVTETFKETLDSNPATTKDERKLMLAEYSDCIDEWQDKQGVDAHEVCKYILELE